MAIIVKPYTAFPGDIIRSSNYNSNFDTIYNDYNGNITNANISPTAGIHYGKLVPMSGDATITDLGVITILGGGGTTIVPIGTILPWYDFGLLTFDATKYHYCDGSTVTVSGIGVQTLPDLSGRYLVGFGTDGGGNIGTAPFSATPVGNAGNTINLQHTHIMDLSGLHGHTGGTQGMYVLNDRDPTLFGSYRVNEDGVIIDATPSNTLITDNNVSIEGNHNHIIDSDGLHGHTNSNALSTAQSIQPRSIRVRFIMRIA